MEGYWSQRLRIESLRRMGVPIDEVKNVGSFSEGQKRYLEYDRDYLFLAANL